MLGGLTRKQLLSTGAVACPHCEQRCKNIWSFVCHYRKSHDADGPSGDTIKQMWAEVAPVGAANGDKDKTTEKPELKVVPAVDDAVKIGDVVVLNSGGPDMTVINVGTDPITPKYKVVQCLFFDDNGQPQSLDLPMDCVGLAEDEE
jgi:uncharacterized protein YodC (DUF2158 family)